MHNLGKMENWRNLKIYRAWAPLYDAIMRPLYGKARRRSLARLDLQAGETALIPGVGTGLDLPLLPPGVQVVGIDLSPQMLAQARAKAAGQAVRLLEMDALDLQFPAASFDAVIFHLILSVVPDGAAAFAEGWRVLRPGGRVVIFDKFLPETGRVTWGRGLLGVALRAIGTDPNRRVSEILGGAPDVVLEADEASLLGGQYRILLARKIKPSVGVV